MSSRLKSLPDVSMNFRKVGTGAADLRKQWLCGCKSHQGVKRGGLLWKCAACARGASK